MTSAADTRPRRSRWRRWTGLALAALVIGAGAVFGAVTLVLDSDTAEMQAVVPAGPLNADDVLQAHGLLLERYIEPLDSKDLLDAAWQGASRRAREAGIDAKLAAPATEAGNAEANAPAFREALAGLAAAAAREVSADTLARSAITAMTASLNDGHTRFIAPEAWETSLRLAPQFQYRSIRTESGTLVWDVSEASTADKGGLKPGDIIKKINGVAPEEKERPPVIQDGSPAIIEVQRPRVGALALHVVPESDGARPFEARMIDSVAYVLLHSLQQPGKKLDGDIAFQDSLSTAVLNLTAASPTGWILDLRDCSGGAIASLGFVAALFGANGQVYEATQRSGATRSIKASGDDAVQGKPLVVLVDGATASAAEIITATLQDSGLAHVIGNRTAKKVDGALRFPLDDGGGLVITFERARAGPLRRVLDGVGVTPDELVVLNTRDLDSGLDNVLGRAIAYLQEESVGRTRP